MIARLRSGFVHRMAVRDNAASSRAATSRRSLRAATLAIAAAGVIALLVCLSIEFRRRQALYWYDVREDYRFEYSGPRTTRLVVDVSAEGFEFPATNAVWDTVVLRLRVDSGWAARWYEPSITLDSGGNSTSRQFFERGARGERYLLVPSTVRPGQRVRLRGAGMNWVPQQTELLLWDNAAPSGATVLVLAPHPDDAEIAAFGLYSTSTSYVVTVTAGNYPDKGYAHLYADPAAQDRLTARIRTWDSLTVPLWGGVPPERTVSLGYSGLSLERLETDHRAGVTSPDRLYPEFGAYRRGAVQELLKSRTATPTWASLVTDLATLLDTTHPDVIVAPHPLLDGNTDHQLTTVALLEALERQSDDRTALFLYTNHHVLTEYYPFGPADSHVTLPPWFDTDLGFTSVYAHPLDDRTQMDKLFALEANHDLRPAPRRLMGGPVDRFLARSWLAVASLVRDPVSDYSYFRRAVRPNELFFVYAPAERRRLAALVVGHGRTRHIAGAR
jgi:LmbE family N-acetylglucosaminyl deacetylase